MINTKYGDCAVNEEGIEKYLTNDFAFRAAVEIEQYGQLRRIGYDDIQEVENYENFIKDYPRYLLMDFTDVNNYIHKNTGSGLDDVDIGLLFSLVCDLFGNESSIDEEVWTTFASDISTVLQAKLGLDEDTVLCGEVFNSCIKSLHDIAAVLINYLVNIKSPIIEEVSLYTLEKYDKGYLYLRVRTFEEINGLYDNE